MHKEYSLRDLLEAIRSIPHGRPRSRTAEAVVEDWRGTCSTKHLLLKALCPEMEVRFVHRVFALTPEKGRALLGDRVAQAIPESGMTDVHTYATGLLNGRRTVIDLTFPGKPWDGTSDMEISCGDGEDYDAGDDPIASKDALVNRLGDQEARQRLIRAISL